MSISRGRFVATFCRPGCKFTGERCEFRDNNWIVFINIRDRSRVLLLSPGDIHPAFDRFEDAKAWAIARLDDLTRERI